MNNNCESCRGYMRAKIIVMLKHDIPYYTEEKIIKILGLTKKEYDDRCEKYSEHISFFENQRNISVDSINKRLVKIEKILEESDLFSLKKQSRLLLNNIEEEIFSKLNNFDFEKILNHYSETNLLNFQNLIDKLETYLLNIKMLNQTKQLDRIETEVLQTKSFLENNFVFEDDEDENE